MSMHARLCFSEGKYLGRPQEAPVAPGLALKANMSLPGRFRKPNWGPLQVQQVVVAAESSSVYLTQTRVTWEEGA